MPPAAAGPAATGVSSGPRSAAPIAPSLNACACPTAPHDRYQEAPLASLPSLNACACLLLLLLFCCWLGRLGDRLRSRHQLEAGRVLFCCRLDRLGYSQPHQLGQERLHAFRNRLRCRLVALEQGLADLVASMRTITEAPDGGAGGIQCIAVTRLRIDEHAAAVGHLLKGDVCPPPDQGWLLWPGAGVACLRVRLPALVCRSCLAHACVRMQVTNSSRSVPPSLRVRTKAPTRWSPESMPLPLLPAATKPRKLPLASVATWPMLSRPWSCRRSKYTL